MLWCLRTSTFYMRQKAATAALVALASIPFCTGPLPAKPTRALPRPAAHRQIVADPAPRTPRERAAHPAAAPHAAAPRPGAAHATLAVHTLAANRESALTGSAYPRSRARTLAGERSLAARAAIAATDRNSRAEYRSETRTIRRAPGSTPENAPHPPFVAPRNPVPLRASSEAGAIADGQAFAPAAIAGAADLDPATGEQPLRSIGEEAATPVLLSPLRLASLYDSRGRLVVPAPLYGSREILLHQNQMADRDGLDRVRDDAGIVDLRRERKLVALPESEALRVDYRLPENRRFSRPWTAAFLSVLAADFYASFHTPLQVDSAVRTVAFQQRLMRTNGNAAPAEGDTASPHLTGQAVDIAKGGLSRTQIAWMRTYLQPLIDLGKIDVEEEFRQSCFHISVYRDFLPIAPQHLSAAARQLSPESEHQPAPESPLQPAPEFPPERPND